MGNRIGSMTCASPDGSISVGNASAPASENLATDALTLRGAARRAQRAGLEPGGWSGLRLNRALYLLLPDQVAGGEVAYSRVHNVAIQYATLKDIGRAVRHLQVPNL